MLKSRFLARYGSLVVLALLCAISSSLTVTRQFPVTARAGEQLARSILRDEGQQASVAIVIRKDVEQDRLFADAVAGTLQAAGARVARIEGSPGDLVAQFTRLAESWEHVDAIATHARTANWGPLRDENLRSLGEQLPAFRETRVHQPASYVWPTFLTRDNLVHVLNRNSDIAIIAIGMTLVIITAGIDLSVGSLVALAAVVCSVTLQRALGGEKAGPSAIVVGCGAALLVAGFCGTINGIMITRFRIPAFIVSLSMMMIARGLALIIAVRPQGGGRSSQGTPEAVIVETPGFTAIADGRWLGIPNPIWIMLGLFVLAHALMTRTAWGRYIYAVGGNPEAARLSGVPVKLVLLSVYALCGALAGLTGVLDASRFGGRPNAGQLYELQAIAAVVVGGASLSGGEGRIFGTLVGSLIIAVIDNGLNMAGVGPYERMVVFGLLILLAVGLDQLRRS